jgi:tRNA-binding protein
MDEIKIAATKSPISTEVLDRIDVRVGTIELVEDVAGSDKLVELVVDFGDRKRRVLVGMKMERENPNEVKGRQALFVVNVEPRKMMGRVSEAMLFDIGYQDGITPVLAVPERPVPNGVRAG